MERPFNKGQNRKVVVLMKDELGEKLMTEYAALRCNTYSYLINDDDGNKKAKGTKKCVIKRELTFEDYKHCLEATQI